MPLILHAQIQVTTDPRKVFGLECRLLNLLRSADGINERALVKATLGGLESFIVLQGRLQQAVMADAGYQVQFQRFRSKNVEQGQLDQRINQPEVLAGNKNHHVAQKPHLLDTELPGVDIYPATGCQSLLEQRLGEQLNGLYPFQYPRDFSLSLLTQFETGGQGFTQHRRCIGKPGGKQLRDIGLVLVFNRHVCQSTRMFNNDALRI